jgi:hypothetical protein
MILLLKKLTLRLQVQNWAKLLAKTKDFPSKFLQQTMYHLHTDDDRHVTNFEPYKHISPLHASRSPT